MIGPIQEDAAVTAQEKSASQPSFFIDGIKTPPTLTVSKMFVAGMVPGILMGLGMIFVSWYISKKRHYPKAERRSTLKEVLVSAKESFFAILMTLIILSGICFGFVTPTEASILAVVYSGHGKSGAGGEKGCRTAYKRCGVYMVKSD